MTRILLTVSLVWLFPAICHGVDIPLQSALMIRGVPMGFTRSSHRHKRSETLNGSVTCPDNEYRPKKAKHCCNKCLAGYLVTSDCSAEGMKSKCDHCPNGFFRPTPSGSKTCLQCEDCLTQFGQVTVKNCTTINNTVCGCPPDYYKDSSDRKFTCLQCSTCKNGDIKHPCTSDRNTVCSCHHNFYPDSTGECRSCDECNMAEDCVKYCPTIPPELALPVNIQPHDVTRIIILGATAFFVLAGAAILIVMNRKRIRSALQTKKTPTADTAGNTPLKTPLMEESTETGKLEHLPGHCSQFTVCVQEDSRLQLQNTAQNSSLPLPDITIVTKTPSLNRPEILYKIIDSVPVGSWRELMRRLGVSDHVIDQSEYDNRRYREAQYAMLSYWVRKEDPSGATSDSLFRVLKDMNLGGCVEKIEECL